MNTSFVAIDFETAINHHICSVGIVTVENGIIIDKFHALIKPPNNQYNWHNIQVHGITERDKLNVTFFNEIYPEIKKSIHGKTMQDYTINYSELNIATKWQCTLKIE